MTTAVEQPLTAPAAAVQSAQAPTPWLAQVMLETVSRTGARLGLCWIGFIGFLAVFSPFLANSHPYLLKTDDSVLVAQYGRWSSPLLKNLTGSDVALLALAIAALVLWRSRLRASHKILLFCAAFCGIIPPAYWKPLLAYVTASKMFLTPPGWFGRSSAVLLILLDLAGLVAILTYSSIGRRAKAVLLSCLGIFALAMVVFPVNPPALSNFSEYREAQAAGRVQVVLRAPIQFSPSDRLRDQFVPDHPHPWAPSKAHPLGTERNGADILSRMMHASRIAMSIGFIATGIAILIGAVVGGLMGYFIGWVDLIGMRVVEIFGSIPTIYLLLAFVAFFDRNLYMMMVIIGLTTWVGDARFVRAEFLRLRGQDFVQAARAAGLPLRSILFRHILPNAMAPLLVSASFGIASAILYESTLSFLGLGLVDEPSWGQLLNEAVSESGGFHWWLATFPGIAIFLTVFAYNLIGEALRDALDPKLKGID